ncbi:hypothetical protein GUJ93_ZPchr0013g34604 [Zizania palustris]|uniref:Uncharacterized protein n=1 Tax=Zizania palustris TaxID=103762 RepID=A0A8J5X3Y1_ZIZPA|nr:hypothetical protein GUJ93_ZPchr0013g34604 [Zizania palustris]
MRHHSSAIHATLLLAAALALHLAAAQPWEYCGGSDTQSNTYRANLRRNLSSSPTLFAIGTIAAAPDALYGLVLRRVVCPRANATIKHWKTFGLDTLGWRIAGSRCNLRSEVDNPVLHRRPRLAADARPTPAPRCTALAPAPALLVPVRPHAACGPVAVRPYGKASPPVPARRPTPHRRLLAARRRPGPP